MKAANFFDGIAVAIAAQKTVEFSVLSTSGGGSDVSESDLSVAPSRFIALKLIFLAMGGGSAVPVADACVACRSTAS